MTRFINKLAIVAMASILTAMPAAAVVETFATASPTSSARLLRWERLGLNNGLIYTTNTATATTPGSTTVRFTFFVPGLEDINNINATFTLLGTTTADPATATGGQLTQRVDSGSFSFLTQAPITIGNLSWASGALLLGGTWTDASLSGQTGATSGALSGSSASGSVISYSSDFISFAPGSQFDFSLSLTSINGALNQSSGDAALNGFRAVAGGQFSSEPPPIGPEAIPEPGVWAMMLVGFGLIGYSRRRQFRAVAA